LRNWPQKEAHKNKSGCSVSKYRSERRRRKTGHRMELFHATVSVLRNAELNFNLLGGWNRQRK